MSQERRKFDKEFKLMAVELSKSRDNIQQLAQELGIRPELIYRCGQSTCKSPRAVSRAMAKSGIRRRRPK